MKKLSACVLAAASMLICLTSCDTLNDVFGKNSGVDKKYYENCAVFTFDDFESKICITLDRTGLGEGMVYYQVNLEEGALSVQYSEADLFSENQLLSEFTADGEMPVSGSGGYVEGAEIAITFEAYSPVSGEIIIAFTEDALKAVQGNLQLHEHTYGEWQYDEFKHWREYTCDCEFESEMDTHTNDDGNALCDVCGYNVGVKADYVIYCQYYYTNEYGSNTHMQIALDGLDVSVLVEISDSLTYVKGDPGSSPTKIQYCIRHYDTDTDSFFVTGDEQYLDLSENFTNERADVIYSIDYVNSQIVRKYTTLEGEVEEYAALSAEQLSAIKAAFQPVADRLDSQKEK